MDDYKYYATSLYELIYLYYLESCFYNDPFDKARKQIYDEFFKSFSKNVYNFNDYLDNFPYEYNKVALDVFERIPNLKNKLKTEVDKLMAKSDEIKIGKLSDPTGGKKTALRELIGKFKNRFVGTELDEADLGLNINVDKEYI
ncbi:hypothetical protein IPJ72_03220 [Candidatus Peregrinibacteria bacterium]|nr:MAG: hypothetical protein IPJ72_03220 [Candidatus Peregrinibacteria bacterium]